MKTVMIISDATGETAERMVRAATLQFSEPVQIRLFSRVRLETELEQLLEKASELRALVVTTVVNAEERDLIGKLVERYNIETVDLIGALADVCERHGVWLDAGESERFFQLFARR